MFSLTGKKVLITGASGGIGGEIATTLHSAGAHVVISGTRREALEALAKTLGERVTVMTCNMSKSEEVIALYQNADQEVGGLDILICNAGVTRDNLMIRMAEEDFDEVIRINLKSAWLLNKEALKSMAKKRVGRIINISSVVACSGNFGQTNYTASKAGLIGMTKSVALEGASRNITANCIAPGFIATPMTDAIKDEIKEKIKATIPLKSFGEPKDIAAAALYLAADEARYVTGTVLHVNGGMYM
jgi:3-oxoacyl-[acyl-carrier protein] reductase